MKFNLQIKAYFIAYRNKKEHPKIKGRSKIVLFDKIYFIVKVLYKCVFVVIYKTDLTVIIFIYLSVKVAVYNTLVGVLLSFLNRFVGGIVVDI